MIGQSTGQVLLNFDEVEGAVDTQKGGTQGYGWKHLYDADYELLFNQRVFPVEMLQGNKIGLYMIDKLELFDFDLKPHNILLSPKHSEFGETHTIQFAVAQRRGTHMEINMESKNQLVYENAVEANQLNKSRRHSPRSSLNSEHKLKKQMDKLEEMKQQALDKLIGLNAFQLMFFSKADYSQQLSNEALKDCFKKRFEISLPLKHFDIVFVTRLGPKKPVIKEETKQEIEARLKKKKEDEKMRKKMEELKKQEEEELATQESQAQLKTKGGKGKETAKGKEAAKGKEIAGKVGKDIANKAAKGAAAKGKKGANKGGAGNS